ncbi:MAG: thioredoxin family protein [Sedimentisphaerales bacterium]|nr:thioredoxin family protein [Sedimentisphaerales bacterium]
MNKYTKIVIVLILILIVGAVIAIKENKRTDSQSKTTGNLKTLPRLVDLGAGKCIPCKMMAPILEELKKNYAGIFNLEFIDVWKNPDEAKKYGVKIIPTQIFFDVAGKELFRHEGFFSKEDILSKWKELGINLKKGQ